ncbi:hypothetical protein BPAE_0122g00290 [Botrytis paeoniae]|uniref:Uncharacterized protein n=1 Tax=Botrytis paeoniae TaxID=278948 RepID=A0A4Z1FMJ6_9HELO|nr:hypothetical protein BPAE_0122g00290 [Botrytis paeoniae]
MKPSIWAYWACLECDKSENFDPRDAHTLMCEFCGIYTHNDSNPQKIAETPHNFVCWKCLHCGRPDKPVAQGTPYVYRYDFCGRQADHRSVEEAYGLNYTSREEKLRNEILWDGTPPAGNHWRLTFREIIGEDTLQKDTTQSDYQENTYEGENHAFSRTDFEKAHENLTSNKDTPNKTLLKRAPNKNI